MAKEEIIYGPASETWGSSYRAYERKWLKFKAFYVNPRGILIHRVQSIAAIFHREREKDRLIRHNAHYFCGNSRWDINPEDLTNNPVQTKLLCARCEIAAMAEGQRPADKIARRHIHLGKVRVQQICHLNESN